MSQHDSLRGLVAKAAAKGQSANRHGSSHYPWQRQGSGPTRRFT